MFATLLFSPTLQHLYIFYTFIHTQDSICCAADLHMYKCSLLLASAWQSRQPALLCYMHALNHAHTMILTSTHLHFTCTVCSKYIRTYDIVVLVLVLGNALTVKCYSPQYVSVDTGSTDKVLEEFDSVIRQNIATAAQNPTYLVDGCSLLWRLEVC